MMDYFRFNKVELESILKRPEAVNWLIAEKWHDEAYHNTTITEEIYFKWINYNIPLPLADQVPIQHWYDTVYAPVKVEEPRPIKERTTFIKALEDAFWEANGPAKLVQLAEDSPLEFLKICAKLIPSELTSKDLGATLNISFNTAPPPRQGITIDQEN